MGQSISWFLDDVFGKKRKDIFMLGLDNAGKTTILYKLKLGEIVTTTPTMRYNTETLEYKNVKFNVCDVGQNKRFLRNYYFRMTAGIIFVVDSSDKERIDLAREELQKALESEEFRNAPFLVLVNKQDLGGMSVAEVTEKLELHTLRERNWYIQGASAITGDGLYEGLDWLAQQDWD